MNAVSIVTRERTGTLDFAPRFRTTRWSVVLAAASDGEQARAALAQLYRAYLQPLVALIARRRGRAIALEVIHAFFAERLLAAKDLQKVERLPDKRFRGWLQVAVTRFSNNQLKFNHQKRRDSRLNVPLGADGEEHTWPLSALVAGGVDPEQQLSRSEALDVLAEALARLRAQYCARATTLGVDGQRRFELALKVFLPGAAGEELGLDDCARELGLGLDATKQLVSRLRRRYSRMLKDTLECRFPDLTDSEALSRLRAALETPPPTKPGR